MYAYTLACVRHSASSHDWQETQFGKGLEEAGHSLELGRASCRRPCLSAGVLQVIIRDHSYYSQDLYDAIMAEWAPLTEKDILVISYGGWYPRFAWNTDEVPSRSPFLPVHAS